MCKLAKRSQDVAMLEALKDLNIYIFLFLKYEYQSQIVTDCRAGIFPE